MTDDPRITIEDNGRILSRIYAGEKLSDIVRVPDFSVAAARGEKIWLVYDRNVAGAADSLAKVLPISSAFAVDATEEGKTVSAVVEICRRLIKEFEVMTGERL